MSFCEKQQQQPLYTVLLRMLVHIAATGCGYNSNNSAATGSFLKWMNETSVCAVRCHMSVVRESHNWSQIFNTNLELWSRQEKWERECENMRWVRLSYAGTGIAYKLKFMNETPWCGWVRLPQRVSCEVDFDWVSFLFRTKSYFRATINVQPRRGKAGSDDVKVDHGHCLNDRVLPVPCVGGWTIGVFLRVFGGIQTARGTWVASCIKLVRLWVLFDFTLLGSSQYTVYKSTKAEMHYKYDASTRTICASV